jgi:excisionase family DNA binding protein
MSQDNESNNGARPQRLAYDIHASAKLVSVAEPTIRKWIRQGRLPRVGGIRKILIPAAALQKFVSTAE